MEIRFGKKAKYALTTVGFTTICALLALAFTDMTSTWYTELEKPTFLPSVDIMLGCWLAVVAASGIALYLCSAKGGFGRRAVCMFALGMSMAAMWHYVFFSHGHIVYAFYTLTLAITAAVCACYYMFQRHVAAGILSLALPIWLCFLAALNYMIFMLN